MKLWIVTLGVVMACGGSTAATKTDPKPDPEPVADTTPKHSADSLDAAGCYDGATRQGKPPPRGNKVWCEKHDKTRHGRYTLWFENATKGLEGVYRDGKLEGLWTRWYDNGNPQSEAHYRNGRNHGSFKRWYENGNRHTEGQYIDGEEQDTWTYWNEDGSPHKVEHYERGVLLER